jgi:hypothetical protein
MMAVCMSFLNGVPSLILDEDNKPLSGVEIVNPLVKKPKKVKK